jgi:hypothetical protein
VSQIAAPLQREAHERLALIGAIAWPSFFAAGIATMVCFAFIDPPDLFDVIWAHLQVSREVGYTIGFFVFWVATLGASTFTALLLRRPNNQPK